MMKLLLVLLVFGVSSTFATYYNAGRISPCLLDKDPGPCEAAIRRYFFNRRTGQCEQFIYGGCLGNANNFKSELSCRKTCRNLECKLPPETGPCRARIISYFFNSTSQKCERFIYGGCQGNANRYSSADECAASCCPYKGMVHSDCVCGLQTCSQPYVECGGHCTAGCDCPHGTVLDEAKKECVPLDQCPSTSCPVKGQVFQQCRTCPATCLNPDLVCTLQCVPGCGCPPGQLIDTVTNSCVRPDRCSLDCSAVLCALPNCASGIDTEVPPGECCPVCVCKVGNQTLFPGDSFQPDCNTCQCTDTGLALCTLIACQPADPCKDFECPTGSTCKVFQPTGEAFCEPSCDLDNGGCASNETCSLQEVQCVRAPCPPVVKCLPKSCPIEGQVFTTCGTACPPTCSEPGPVACTTQCVVGCQCPVGTVLDDLQQKCVNLDQCECPPTCSHQFCSNHRNKYKPCSRPPPFTVPPCPDKCRTTFCQACYYSDTAQPTPSYCDNVCKFSPSTRCLRYWSQCVYYHGIRSQGLDYYMTPSSDNFRCYEYNCPLRG